MSNPAAPGQSDLAILLGSMRPMMAGQPYAFQSISQEAFARLTFVPLCAFRESEGVTVIATQEQAQDQGWPTDGGWACITLSVHSSLLAVGFLAAVAGALAREGISVNPVSAYYHDHLFVPWERRRQAMEVLESLSRSQGRGTR